MHLPFIAPVAGISFRRNAAAATFEGEPLTIRPDDSTPDPHAMAVHGSDGRQLGYLPAALAKRVSQAFGRVPLDGRVVDVLGDVATDGGLRVEVAAVAEGADVDAA